MAPKRTGSRGIRHGKADAPHRCGLAGRNRNLMMSRMAQSFSAPESATYRDRQMRAMRNLAESVLQVSRCRDALTGDSRLDMTFPAAKSCRDRRREASAGSSPWREYWPPIQRSSRSAPFSPIMIAAALVLPESSRGITAASTTRVVAVSRIGQHRRPACNRRR